MRPETNGYKDDSLRSLRSYNKNDIRSSSTTIGSSSPKKTGRPHVAEHLLKAEEWQRLLDTDRIPSRSAIAHREGLSRAGVSQLLSLLNLAPKIRQYILSMPKTTDKAIVTERTLRSLTRVKDKKQQIETFERITASV